LLNGAVSNGRRCRRIGSIGWSHGGLLVSVIVLWEDFVSRSWIPITIFIFRFVEDFVLRSRLIFFSILVALLDVTTQRLAYFPLFLLICGAALFKIICCTLIIFIVVLEVRSILWIVIILEIIVVFVIFVIPTSFPLITLSDVTAQAFADLQLFLLVGSAALFTFICRTLIIFVIILRVVLLLLVVVVVVVIVVVAVIVLLVVVVVVVFHDVLVLLVVIVIIIIFILVLFVIVVLVVTIVLPSRLGVIIIVSIFLPAAFFINTPEIFANLLFFSYCKVVVLITADVASEHIALMTVIVPRSWRRRWS